MVRAHGAEVLPGKNLAGVAYEGHQGPHEQEPAKVFMEIEKLKEVLKEDPTEKNKNVTERMEEH